MGAAVPYLPQNVVEHLSTAVLVVLLLLTPSPTPGENGFDQGVIEPQANSSNGDVTVNDKPLRGLITRRTVTQYGDAFYRRFVSSWRSRGIDAPNGLVIEERPTARQGSLVTVRHARETVFRGYVRPQGPDPEEVADQAVQQVELLVERQQQAGGRNNPDLAEEELQ